jgi:hypothetical protein
MPRGRRHLWLVAVLLALISATAAPPALAQGFSTADLAGLWRVNHLATPTTSITGGSVRSYSGVLIFDTAGAATGDLFDDLFNDYTVTGSLTLSPTGVVTGTLTLNDGLGGGGSLLVREARILVNKYTIVGAATVLGDVGLFTFVRLDTVQTFTLDDDLAGDWNYHEVTPVTDFTGTTPAQRIDNEARWSTGSITFHDTASGNPFCTEADLTFAGGTIRSQRTGPTSFG